MRSRPAKISHRPDISGRVAKNPRFDATPILRTVLYIHTCVPDIDVTLVKWSDLCTNRLFSFQRMFCPFGDYSAAFCTYWLKHDRRSICLFLDLLLCVGKETSWCLHSTRSFTGLLSLHRICAQKRPCSAGQLNLLLMASSHQCCCLRGRGVLYDTSDFVSRCADQKELSQTYSTVTCYFYFYIPELDNLSSLSSWSGTKSGYFMFLLRLRL